MTITDCMAMAAAFALICAVGAAGQTKDPASPETAPPKLAVLVYQLLGFEQATKS